MCVCVCICYCGTHTSPNGFASLTELYYMHIQKERKKFKRYKKNQNKNVKTSKTWKEFKSFPAIMKRDHQLELDPRDLVCGRCDRERTGSSARLTPAHSPCSASALLPAAAVTPSFPLSLCPSCWLLGEFLIYLIFKLTDLCHHLYPSCYISYLLFYSFQLLHTS